MSINETLFSKSAKFFFWRNWLYNRIELSTIQMLLTEDVPYASVLTKPKNRRFEPAV